MLEIENMTVPEFDCKRSSVLSPVNGLETTVPLNLLALLVTGEQLPSTSCGGKVGTYTTATGGQSAAASLSALDKDLNESDKAGAGQSISAADAAFAELLKVLLVEERDWVQAQLAADSKATGIHGVAGTLESIDLNERFK